MLYLIGAGHRRAGLFSYVLQALHNLSAVDGTDDKIYLDYSSDLPYLDKEHGPNVWDYYFEQPFKISENELREPDTKNELFIRNGREVSFCQAIQSDNMILKGRELCKKYIKIHPHILQKVDDFLESNDLEKGNYFSMHRRGTDYYQDATILPLETYFCEADLLFDRFDKCVLCTDESRTVEQFKKRYGDKICSYDAIRSDNNEGIHYSVGLVEPYKMGEDVLIDSLLLSHSAFLVRVASGVSFFSLYYNENLESKDIDSHIWV